MVNLTKISKVVLVAGALAFASFYSNPSYAIWDAPDDYYSSGSGNTETGNTPPVNMPALTAPTTNLADMAGSIELPTTIESRDPLVKASKAAAEKDAAKEKLDQIEKQYQADLQDLNAQISKEGISKKEKKELQQKIADLKKQYQKDQSEAATAYNNALSEYQTNKTAATSNVSVNAKRSAYNAARQEYNNLAKCAEAPADCKDSNGNPITDADGNPLTTTTLNALLAEKKAAADAAYNDYRAEQNALTGKNADLQKDVQNAKNEVKDLEQKLEDAQNGCNYYKQNGAVSKAAKADQEKYCGLVDTYTSELEAAKNKLSAAQSAAQSAGVSGGDEHEGEVYAAFSTASSSGVDADGNFDGTYRGTATYDVKDGDIFNTITRRAMLFLVSLKPIIYVFAGFGLIGFAFMAIFNKISWKWFSNIAIGLFLVANMGRFIEYFVFPEGGLSNNQLSYGDYLNKGFADTEYKWVEASAIYTAPTAAGVNGEVPAEVASPEAEKDVRGFCGKTEGASGWSNFSSCIKDITAAGKKAVDTAKTAKATVDKVKNGVKSVKNAAQNIGDAVKNAKGNGLSGIIKAAGQIGSNVNNMVGTAGGVVNGVMSNVSKISNNVQDVTKSTDEVAELNEQRSKGEATNALDRLLKGQTTGADGTVEHLYGGTDQNGNAVEGKVASDSNVFTNIKDTTDNIMQKSKESNTMLQGLTSTAYEGTKLVEDVTGVTDKLRQKKQQQSRSKSASANNNSNNNNGGTNQPLTGGDKPTNNGGTNQPLTGGDKPTNNGGTNQPLTGGDKPTNNGGTNQPLTGGDKPTNNGGTNQPLTGGDKPTNNGGTNQPLTGGDKPTDNGGTNQPLTGGDKPTDNGGTNQPLTGGDKPTNNGGTNQPLTGGDKPTNNGGSNNPLVSRSAAVAEEPVVYNEIEIVETKTTAPAAVSTGGKEDNAVAETPASVTRSAEPEPAAVPAPAAAEPSAAENPAQERRRQALAARQAIAARAAVRTPVAVANDLGTIDTTSGDEPTVAATAAVEVQAAVAAVEEAQKAAKVKTEEARAASNEAARLAAVAAQTNNPADIAAAQQAADAARQKQQEAVDAQKVIDEQIRLRTTAQQRYYALTTDNSLENRLEQEDEEHAEEISEGAEQRQMEEASAQARAEMESRAAAFRAGQEALQREAEERKQEEVAAAEAEQSRDAAIQAAEEMERRLEESDQAKLERIRSARIKRMQLMRQMQEQQGGDVAAE
ncbi:MAG: hypothetical protein KHX61_04325 [Proteobacteria bacterium]|nr:hypothetical protein [Pseudomonadota bacterium]